MAKRMLIDATHPEETRVVVVNGNRLEEFDFESSTKKQVKGNIYLAKVTRVEPSLQAAFVEYGGNRHGFLAFSEIHPDYYRIPVGDRREFGADPQAREPMAGSEAGDDAGVPLEEVLPEPVTVSAAATTSEEAGEGELPGERDAFGERKPLAAPAWGEPDTGSAERDRGMPDRVEFPWEEGPIVVSVAREAAAEVATEEAPAALAEPTAAELEPAEAEPLFAGSPAAWAEEPEREPEDAPQLPFDTNSDAETAESPRVATTGWAAASADDDAVLASESAIAPPQETAPDGAIALNGEAADPDVVETLGGDEFEEAERQRSRVHRHYKIQEVVKRRQIMLVQVTKEERGNKGAALTTYLSLAGRYCVLMPNTARGGGVSRKITSLGDRRRLKDILEELDIPEGMGVIVRTAGAERSKAEIKRDYEYLLRLWNEIRELTLRSTAPAVIYEEGDLIKRSIRDLYTRDIDEVLVEGEDGYRTAKAFMKMLMPSHAKRVQPYRDPQIGLLHRFQVESQIDAIHSPIVQLRSGGYVVINQTEALVAIDVNSGRSTRERNIEETALRTNLEAAEEIARQLRLRDLAGLIVIDFIDMEEHRNQGAVERRLKDALKNDRARIQVGRISPFGLLEMSRQRLRPSLVEASTQPCPHCGGTGTIRSTESTALYVLRSIEEEGMRRRSAEACVYVPTTVALYILNHKRDSLAQIETRYGIHVLVARDDTLIPPAFRLERLRPLEPGEAAAAPPLPLTQAPEPDVEDAEEDVVDETVEADDAERSETEEERGRARRRRRRRRHHEDERVRAPSAAADDAEEPAAERTAELAAEPEAEPGDGDDEAARLRRRRGRRGGRRRARREDAAGASLEIERPAADFIEIVASDAAGTGEGASEAQEEAPAIARDELSWPSPASAEPSSAPAATEIETASLPALAGDAAPPDEPPAEEARADEYEYPAREPLAAEPVASEPPASEPAASESLALASEPPPSEHPAGEPPAVTVATDEHPGGESPVGEPPPGLAAPPLEKPADAVPAEPMPAAAAGDDQRLHAVLVDARHGNGAVPETGYPPTERPDEAAFGAEVVAGAAPAPGMPSETEPAVQEVTSKPENPRRGWWQRLIQS